MPDRYPGSPAYGSRARSPAYGTDAPFPDLTSEEDSPAVGSLAPSPAGPPVVPRRLGWSDRGPATPHQGSGGFVSSAQVREAARAPVAEPFTMLEGAAQAEQGLGSQEEIDQYRDVLLTLLLQSGKVEEQDGDIYSHDLGPGQAEALSGMLNRMNVDHPER